MLHHAKTKRILLVSLVALAGILALKQDTTYTLQGSITKASPPAPSVVDTVAATRPASMVTIGQVAIPVELATTTAAIEKGLSGRTALDSGRGMLFIFKKSDKYRFWMSGMHFPLDMIWINKGRVVDISENVSNEFDPAHPRFYSPSKPAQYVLEVNAGFAARNHIQVSSTVVLSGI